MIEDAFAFGDNRICGHPSPVIAALGEDTERPAADAVAYRYDTIVRERRGIYRGLISERATKQVWKRVKADIEQDLIAATDDPDAGPDEYDRLRGQLEVVRDVATELGWAD